MTPTLVWCYDCDDFSDGELIRTRKEWEYLLANCTRTTMPRPYSSICDTESKRQRFSNHVDRCLNALSFRSAPPKCLACGSDRIEPVTAQENEAFEDGRGRSASWRDWVAGGNNRLFVYDENANLIVEMSSTCPDDNVLILSLIHI